MDRLYVPDSSWPLVMGAFNVYKVLLLRVGWVHCLSDLLLAVLRCFQRFTLSCNEGASRTAVPDAMAFTTSLSGKLYTHSTRKRRTRSSMFLLCSCLCVGVGDQG